MNHEEIQKLIREAFELGYNQGCATFQISDYCTSAEQETEVWDAVVKQNKEFETRTGFKVG